MRTKYHEKSFIELIFRTAGSDKDTRRSVNSGINRAFFLQNKNREALQAPSVSPATVLNISYDPAGDALCYRKRSFIGEKHRQSCVSQVWPAKADVSGYQYIRWLSHRRPINPEHLTHELWYRVINRMSLTVWENLQMWKAAPAVYMDKRLHRRAGNTSIVHRYQGTCSKKTCHGSVPTGSDLGTISSGKMLDTKTAPSISFI